MVLTIKTKKSFFAIGKAEDFVFEVKKDWDIEDDKKVWMYPLTAKKPGASYVLYTFQNAKDAKDTFSSIVTAIASGTSIYTIEKTDTLERS